MVHICFCLLNKKKACAENSQSKLYLFWGAEIWQIFQAVFALEDVENKFILSYMLLFMILKVLVKK